MRGGGIDQGSRDAYGWQLWWDRCIVGQVSWDVDLAMEGSLMRLAKKELIDSEGGINGEDELGS